MINDISLLIDLKNSWISSNGRLVCNIYFSFDNLVYPSKTWHDFVEVILNWWLIELSKRKKIYNLYFMDGPYELTAKFLDNDLVEIYFDNEHPVICNTKSLVKSIINASNKLLKKYIKDGFNEKSIDILKDNIDKVIKMYKIH